MAKALDLINLEIDNFLRWMREEKLPFYDTIADARVKYGTEAFVKKIEEILLPVYLEDQKGGLLDTYLKVEFLRYKHLSPELSGVTLSKEQEAHILKSAMRLLKIIKLAME